MPPAMPLVLAPLPTSSDELLAERLTALDVLLLRLPPPPLRCTLTVLPSLTRATWLQLPAVSVKPLFVQLASVPNLYPSSPPARIAKL